MNILCLKNNKIKTTTLHTACAEGDIERVKELLEEGADVNEINSFTPLHKVVDGCQGKNLAKRRNQILKLLVEKGSCVNSPSHSSLTPLHLAAREGNEFATRYLLEHGAQVNNRDNWNTTPLHYATRKGYDSIVRILIEYGADLNLRNDSNATALHFASRWCRIETVELILNENIEIYSTDKDGRDALHYCALSGDLNTFKLLLSRGFEIDKKDDNGDTPLHIATKGNNPSLIVYILERQKFADARNYSLYTPLHSAIIARDVDICITLINYGADVRLTDIRGWTTLHFACVSKYLPVVQLMMKYNPDINATAEDDSTPLHMAILGGEETIIETLLKLGADPNMCDYCGNTSVRLAMRNNRYNCIPLLLNYGADVTIGDASNYSPLSISLAEGYTTLNKESHHLICEQANKLKALKALHIDAELAAKLEEYDPYHYQLCLQEVKKMKHTILTEGISFHCVFTTPVDKLYILYESCHVKGVINKIDIREFPIYYGLLSTRLAKGCQRYHLFTRACVFFDLYCCNNNQFYFNFDCIEIIVSYLDDTDLEVLSELCRNHKPHFVPVHYALRKPFKLPRKCLLLL